MYGSCAASADFCEFGRSFPIERGPKLLCSGTTVYLADRRFNMLPPVLSEDLCSLRQNVDRFAGASAMFLRPWHFGCVAGNCLMPSFPYTRRHVVLAMTRSERHL